MAEISYRPIYHIQPPAGWLNDPNGSCWYNGAYHIYFQYTPDNPQGGNKWWGHYSSFDLAHFHYEGILLSPDASFDADGVYSGTAWVRGQTLELYYTGNVFAPGEHDYINEGMEHNVCRATTQDGFSVEKKELLLENKDYPKELSCHVRDPKIFLADGSYHMLLGARTRDSRAGLLFMNSSDLDHWDIEELFLPDDDFGFMFECPDFFSLDGRKVVAFCPQGMPHEQDRFQNVYESGYVLLEEGKEDSCESPIPFLAASVNRDHFVEFDMGFDFYAPQTFLTPDKRRILIGWAGVPDAEYDNAPAVAEGWQHTMTVPRELTLCDGRIYSNPVEELALLHGRELSWSEENPQLFTSAFDVTIDFSDEGEKTISLNADIAISYQNGILSLKHQNETGRGRTKRLARCSDLRRLRILFDVSMLEIFANDGEVAMTTRYYCARPDAIALTVESAGAVQVVAYEMLSGIEVPDGISNECDQNPKTPV